MRLSEHFTLEEFLASDTADKLGIENSYTYDAWCKMHYTAWYLETIRMWVKEAHPADFKGLRITSGYRHIKLNEAVGGKDTSYHVLGLAADIVAPNITARELFNVIKARHKFILPINKCIIERETWVHLSFFEPEVQQVTEFYETWLDDGNVRFRKLN